MDDKDRIINGLQEMIEKLVIISQENCVGEEKDFDDTEADYYTGVKDGTIIMARDIFNNLIELFDANGTGE